MHDDVTSCRFHLPGAVAHRTDRYDRELEYFREVDEDAAELYEALVRDAEQYGLHVDDNAELEIRSSGESPYRAPVGLWAFRRKRVDPIPWLGEIRAYGSDYRDDLGPFWRGYFTDLRYPGRPEEQIDDVLLASIRMKGGPKGVKKGEQDRHITDAGDTIRRWCRSNGTFTFRVRIYIR